MVQITTSQFIDFCNEYGKSNFIKRRIDIRPGRKPMNNIELRKIIKWLDKHCESPYYTTKERQNVSTYVSDIVFYFMNEQDSMIFTLCYGEIFK